MSDDEIVAVTKIFGNPEGEIQYLDFIKAATPNDEGFGEVASKTFTETFRDFKGESDLDRLMRNIKITVKKN